MTAYLVSIYNVFMAVMGVELQLVYPPTNGLDVAAVVDPVLIYDLANTVTLLPNPLANENLVVLELTSWRATFVLRDVLTKRMDSSTTMARCLRWKSWHKKGHKFRRDSDQMD
jgi:hypothetical protein